MNIVLEVAIIATMKIYCQNVSYLREISQFMGRTCTYLPIYPKNERIGTGDRGDRKKLPREGRTGRWVTSGATSINKGVENAQLEPWPPRDRRATGSRINVNSFAITDGRCACIALVCARCRFYRTAGRILFLLWRLLSPESWASQRAAGIIAARRTSLLVGFRPISSALSPSPLREYIDIFLFQFRKSNSANW